MGRFCVHLVGQQQPLGVDFLVADLYELMEEVGRLKFIAGHISEPDEDGVYRRVIIATNRIQVVTETD